MTTPRVRPSLIALLAGSAVLAGCASLPGGGAEPQPANPLARTPTEQYSAPALADGADEILLASTGSLSPSQAAALGELAMRWRDDGGTGPIVVDAASTGPAAGTAAAAAQALTGYGVPASSIRQAHRDPSPEAATAPVRVGFATLVAVLPDCSTQWGELTHTRENKPAAGFGCAVSSNMAAMIANPRDLVQPRAGAPADGDRRADVIDKYRKGQPTGAQRSPDERGVVSNSIQ